MSLTSSFSGNFTNLNELYRSFLDTGALSSSFIQSSLTTQLEAAPKIDYANFKEHIFFDNATRKLDAAFYNILNNYPIGSNSGTALSALTGADVATVNTFLQTCTPFEKYVISYLGGVTSGDLTIQPSITAGASANGVVYSLIVVYRGQNNSISGQQASLCAQIYNIANNFDNDNYNTVYQPYSSGTADHQITYTSSGMSLTSELVPKTILERINRDSDLKRLIPTAYFYNDNENILEQYLAVIGRVFDDIKIYIDEFINLNRISYSQYHKTPDGVFKAYLAKQYGIDLIETGLNENLTRYLRSINTTIPSQQVSNIIYDRILNNLIYILKSKGTKEAIEAIIRLFGLPTNYLMLSDYKYFQQQAQINRVDYINTNVLQNNTTSGALLFNNNTINSWFFNYDGYTNIYPSFTVEARISLTGNYEQSLSGIILQAGDNLRGYWLSYSGGIVNFRLNNNVAGNVPAIASTSASTSAQILNAITSGFINVFGINNGTSTGNAFQVITTWMDYSSGSAVYNSITSTTVTSTTAQGIGANTTSALIGAFIGANGTASLSAGFVGYIHNIKGYSLVLNNVDIEEHTRNFDSISVMNSPGGSPTALRFYYRLKENQTLSGLTNLIIDSSGNSNTGYAVNSLSATDPYTMIQLMRKQTRFTYFGPFSDDNTDFVTDVNTINPIRNVSNRTISLSLNPIDAVNKDIQNVLGNFSMANLVADPRNFYDSTTSIKNYPIMEISAGLVFSRYDKHKLNFNPYIKAIDNFSFVINGIINLVQQFIPARSRLLTRGIMIAPHLLNRPRNRQPTVGYLMDLPTVSSSIAFFDEQLTDLTSSINIKPLNAGSVSSIMFLTNNVVSPYGTDKVTTIALANNSLSAGQNILNALGLRAAEAIAHTDFYKQITGDRNLYISQTGVGHTLNTVYILSPTNILYPFYQDVANKLDTSILFTTNRNIIETDSSLSANTNRNTITGNARLIRTSTGKIITSQLNALRIVMPSSNSSNLISVTAFGQSVTASPSDFNIPTTYGIDFLITSISSNIAVGIQNLRFVNLLSGAAQDFPLIILATTADTSSLGGGQTIIQIGSVSI